jgi:hypothetical protein
LFSSQAIAPAGDEPLVALLHDGLGHLVGQVGGRRAGAREYWKVKARRSALRARRRRVSLEVLLGLAGEPDDDVGGDGGVGHGGADALEDAEEALAAGTSGASRAAPV